MAKAARRAAGTRTRSFGASRRENHDSSDFYAQRLFSGMDRSLQAAPAAPPVETPLPSDLRNAVICADSRRMDQVPDGSVHLMVTSPPYNVGKEYDEDLSLGEYLDLLRDVFRETYRVLAPGGRACVNVANLGRRPYIPLHSYVIQLMIEDCGFLMRGEIIWQKAAGSSGSCAWGSWRSASNPTLRDIHEYILVFSKETFRRERGGREDTITREAFLESTLSVWSFPPERASRVGHPAPFPVELPERLIHLYTFKGDVVLDPFCGSGSTCVAAAKTGRAYLGFDINEEYVRIARERLQSPEAAPAASAASGSRSSSAGR